MHRDIATRVERAISEKVFPGCVIGLVRADGKKEIWPFGRLTHETTSPAVRADTVYDLASVTKSIPVASLTLVLNGEGKLKLSDLVKQYIPELHNDHGATIEDLLLYRVSGIQMSTLSDKSPEEISRLVFSTGFDSPPRESQYTNLPAFLLGIILERITSTTIDALAQKYFFDPLNMSHTTFALSNEGFTKSIIAPTEMGEGGEEICGIVHDESARVFSRARHAVGHAGLFSTAPDILNFLAMLLTSNEGFTKSIVAGAQRGLGWQLSQPWMGLARGPQTFGKTGFTGTSVVCDMGRGVAFVILSNRTYPKRPSDATSPNSAINVFRSGIATILLGKT